MPIIEDDLRAYDDIVRGWSTMVHDTLHEDSIKGERRFLFSCELEGLLLVVATYIGKRGGLSERIALIDPRRRPVIEAVLLNEFHRGREYLGDGYLVPMNSIREQVRNEGLDLIRVCRATMELLLARVLAHPQQYATQLRGNERVSDRQLEGYSGGLPSLGKRT